MRTGDIVSGAALLCLGAYIIYEARGWEYLGPDGPGPGFFPLWYGIALVALSAVLVATSLAQRGEAAEPASASGSRVGTGRAYAAWAALAALVALLKLLGFIVAFTLFALFLVRILYREPWGKAAAIAVGGAVGFYLLFAVALGVALPVGPLGF